MSIQSQLDRIRGNFAEAYSAVEDKGGKIPSQLNSANLAAAVESIPIGGNDMLDFVARNLPSEFVNQNIVTVGQYGMAALGCTKIVLENVESIGNYGLAYNAKATEIKCPNVLAIGAAAFDGCLEVTKMEFFRAQSAGNAAFRATSKLETLIIRTPSVMSLATVNVFINSAIGNGAGYIYVPKNMMDTYKETENWSKYADQIRAIEDYPEICGT